MLSLNVIIQLLSIKFAVFRHLSSLQTNQFFQIDSVFKVYSRSSTVLYSNSNFNWCSVEQVAALLLPSIWQLRWHQPVFGWPSSHIATAVDPAVDRHRRHSNFTSVCLSPSSSLTSTDALFLQQSILQSLIVRLLITAKISGGSRGVAMASRRAAFSGNTSLIVTLSSLV